MFAMVVYACLATVACTEPERADVSAETWFAPTACAAATPMAIAAWTAQNPGWRVVRAVCLPLDRVIAHIDRTLGQGV